MEFPNFFKKKSNENKEKLKETYLVKKVNLDDVFCPEGETLKKWKNFYNTDFTLEKEEELVIFNQKLKALEKTDFKEYQADYIKKGLLEEAWKETLKTAISTAIDNALKGRETNPFLKKVNVTIKIFKKENELIIEIKDDGEGILEEVMSEIRSLKNISENKKNLESSSRGKYREGGRGFIKIKEALEQLGGGLKIATVRKEEAKNGQKSGTTISFVFSINNQ